MLVYYTENLAHSYGECYGHVCMLGILCVQGGFPFLLMDVA